MLLQRIPYHAFTLFFLGRQTFSIWFFTLAILIVLATYISCMSFYSPLLSVIHMILSVTLYVSGSAVFCHTSFFPIFILIYLFVRFIFCLDSSLIWHGCDA